MPNASSYHIYYATVANFTPQNYASAPGGTWLQNVSSPRVISGLTNGQTYYFVVTSVAGGVESAPSLNVKAAPAAPVASMAPTPNEVLAMELINRARLNPEAEAQIHGIGLNDGGTSISPAPKPPLAPNEFLVKAARNHSQWMMNNNVFSHTGDQGSSPTDRILAAGYALTGSWTTGENIAWQGVGGGSINLKTMVEQHHSLLFKSPGHRANMLNASFRQQGVGQVEGDFRHDNGQTYLSSMLTQNFARSGNAFYLTGVVYQDANGNDFYDPGEALSGVSLQVNGQNYPPFASGAYAIPLANGSYEVTVTGAGSVDPVTVQISNSNVKLDVIRRNGITEILTLPSRR